MLQLAQMSLQDMPIAFKIEPRAAARLPTRTLMVDCCLFVPANQLVAVPPQPPIHLVERKLNRVQPVVSEAISGRPSRVADKKLRSPRPGKERKGLRPSRTGVY